MTSNDSRADYADSDGQFGNTSSMADMYATRALPARVKGGPSERIPFGLAGDGRMYEALDVPLGKACGCICPACRQPIIAKHCLASDRLAHFAHLARAECSSGFETAVHLAAKQLIAERGELHFPELAVSVYRVDAIDKEHRASLVLERAGVRTLGSVALEQWMGTIRPDLVVSAGELGDVLVEIAVTHFVDQDKQQKIERLGLAAIEIDLSGLRDATFEALSALLFDSPTLSKWLHHPRMPPSRAALLESLSTKLENAARLAAENKELWEGQQAEAQVDYEERMKQYQLRLDEAKRQAEEESLQRRRRHHADMKKAAIFKGRTEESKLAALTSWMGSDRLPAVLSVNMRGGASFGVTNAHIWQTALFGGLVHKRLPNQPFIRKDLALPWLNLRFDLTPVFKDSCDIAVWDYLVGLTKRGALFALRGGSFRIAVANLRAFDTIHAVLTGKLGSPDVLEWVPEAQWPDRKSNEEIAKAMLGRSDLTFLWGKMVDVQPRIRHMSAQEACREAAQYDIEPAEALAFMVRAGLLRLPTV